MKKTLIALLLTTNVIAEETSYYTGIKYGIEKSNTGGSDAVKWSAKFGKHINEYLNA